MSPATINTKCNDELSANLTNKYCGYNIFETPVEPIQLPDWGNGNGFFGVKNLFCNYIVQIKGQPEIQLNLTKMVIITYYKFSHQTILMKFTLELNI